MDIYVEYGFSLNHTINVVKPGKTGADEIKQMMVDFRANPPKELAGSEVVLVKDYQTLKATDNKGGVTAIDHPNRPTYCSGTRRRHESERASFRNLNPKQVLRGGCRRDEMPEMLCGSRKESHADCGRREEIFGTVSRKVYQ